MKDSEKNLAESIRHRLRNLCRSYMLQMSRPYSTDKDSGVEWLGEIPAHWDLILSEITGSKPDD
jgi:hypothetical protein